MTRPLDLVEEARRLIERPDGGLAGVWPRAAALLARRALEDGLDALWERRAPGMQRASARAQLLCLGEYLPDRALARDVAYAWTELSDACHHHAYELGPTAEELSDRLAVVERLLKRLAAV